MKFAIISKSGQKSNTVFILASVILLSIAFFQCYRTTHDLHWAYDTDFDRDMAFIQNTLDGHFGHDPSYSGEYLWYNPLLFSIETIIVKISGLPVNTVVTQSGVYLNLLCPLAFIFMMCFFFDYRIALACFLSYLFLASGNFVDPGSATYSPWLYPSCFSQCLFYITIILCYQAFAKQTYFSFFLLGAFIGLLFLAHTAPAVLIVLIFISVWVTNIISALTARDTRSLRTYVLQALATFCSFTAVSFPLLIFILGKYHLHVINRQIFEYHSERLAWWNFFGLLKANLSFPFIVSIIGFAWFYKNIHHPLKRKIFLTWFFWTAFLLVYTIILPGIREKFHITLPPIVPSYHYFFYLKALQSVFFGFGFVFLFQQVLKFIQRVISRPGKPPELIFPLVILTYAFAYFPVYKNRNGFTEFRKLSLEKENKKDKIGAYDYILHNISPDKVILCEEQYSIFPVMATGRKLVCASILFSNPYVDFGKRYDDANTMLSFLKTGQPESTAKLFNDYHVGFALLSNKEINDSTLHSPILQQVLYKNDMFTVFAINNQAGKFSER